MKKKIIITFLGLFGLMGINALINIFVFDRGVEGMILMPVWTIIYAVYMYVMIENIYIDINNIYFKL